MREQVAVSFEDDLVKIVYASYNKGRPVIHQTYTVQDDEFDSFIRSHKMSNISVVYPFRKFYSDLIYAPSNIKKSYLETIVDSEIQKRFPELRNFSFFYSVLTDKSSDEKGLREVFFFAVETEEIDRIIDRFDRQGKTVKFIYPDIHALSHFVKDHDEYGHKVVLCLLSTQTDKCLILVKSGQLRFIRITGSTGKNIGDTDIDNINMTVSYCSQQLRLNPEKLVLLNTTIDRGNTSGNTVISPVLIDRHKILDIPEETFRQFIAPLSLILFPAKLKKDSLLPLKYKTLYMQRFVVKNISIFFLLFAFLALGFLTINLSEISMLRGKIKLLRRDLTGAESVVAAYDKNSERLQRALSLINLINEARSGLEIKKSLAALNFLPMGNVNIQSITINNSKDALQIKLSGNVHGDMLESMHITFQQLLNKLRQDSSMTVLSHNLDLKSGNFQIDIESRRR